VETWEWIVLVAAAAALVLLALWFFSIRRRRSHLQERFGPEYDRAVSSSGRGSAERQLSDVEVEHEELRLRPLSATARDRYLEEWQHAEARFVSDPRDAARAAGRVVERLLEDRGYPVEEGVERRAALVSVDHPDVVDRYRHGHEMLEQVDGDQSTENLRKAMIDFRAVFEELLETEQTAA
jgi:hypothetical protein